MPDSKRKFWSSIPGLITGTAGVVTALVGLFTVLIQLEVIGKDSDEGTDGTIPVTEPGGATVPRAGPGGTGPAFSVSPTEVAFTLLKREADVTVRNTGSSPLSVTTQLLGRDITQFDADAQDCNDPVATRCVIKVTYAPSAPADHVARLQVTVRGATAQDVTLTGKGL